MKPVEAECPQWLGPKLGFHRASLVGQFRVENNQQPWMDDPLLPGQGQVVKAEVDDEEEPGQERQVEDDLKGFQLPYPVATLQDVEQRAYINEKKGNTPEWLYQRVHAYCGVAKDSGRLLRNNQASLKEAFESLQVPMEMELHYRKQGEPEEGHEAAWQDHTLGSGGFFAFLLWAMRNRALKASTKVKALNLFLIMAQKAMDFAFLSANPEVVCMVLMHTGQGTLVSEELHFSEQGLCHDRWKGFLHQNTGAIALWEKLGSRTWLNRCISSSSAHASWQDICFFLCFIYCHQTLAMARTHLWKAIGRHCLPIVLNQAAQWLNHMARELGKQALQQLPELRTKTGRAKRCADPVNKLLLLWKLRKKKLHRKTIGSTHDTGKASQRMLKFENYIDCLLYLQQLESAFGGDPRPQLSISWDPSTYGGKDTFVGCVYNPQTNLAGYLPNQQLTQVMVSDLETSLLPLARSRKLTRLDGYKDLKGLSASLGGIGLRLEDFKVPEGLLWRPMQAGQFRLRGANGNIFVVDEDGHVKRQLPDGLDLGNIPCLVSTSDQGPKCSSTELLHVQQSGTAFLVDLGSFSQMLE